MTKVRTWAGLDVHAAATVACVVDVPSGEMSVQRLAGRTSEVTAFCARLPAPVRVGYEAGPTGFELARALAAAGVACVVAAPGKIERPAQDRVKTDRRDAERLVRLLMIGGLHPVRVPSGEEEALRDLVRAREDIRGDLMRSRHRLGKLLLRHDVRYDDTASAWTTAHRAWLSRVDLGEGAAQATLLDYLGAIDALVIRRDTIERMIAEIGDFSRFDRPGKLASYLGLVPSERSSGQTRRQGAITKAGSRHARRLLVEAAWHYRRPPRRGTTLQRRHEGQPAQVLAISWKAQQRLHHLWRRLDSERGKRKTIVAVAVARHLAGFCWAITTTTPDT